MNALRAKVQPKKTKNPVRNNAAIVRANLLAGKRPERQDSEVTKRIESVHFATTPLLKENKETSPALPNPITSLAVTQNAPQITKLSDTKSKPQKYIIKDFRLQSEVEKKEDAFKGPLSEKQSPQLQLKSAGLKSEDVASIVAHSPIADSAHRASPITFQKVAPTVSQVPKLTDIKSRLQKPNEVHPGLQSEFKGKDDFRRGVSLEKRGPQLQPDTQAESGAEVITNFTRSGATHIARSFPAFGEQIGQQLSKDRTSYNSRAPPLTAIVFGKNRGTKSTDKDTRPVIGIPADSGALLDASVDSIKEEPSTRETQLPSQPDGQSFNTSAGQKPLFQPMGDAAPVRTQRALNNATGQASKTHNLVAAELEADRSAERIQPVKVEKTASIIIDEVQPSVQTSISEEMAEYAFADVPDGVRQVADQDFTPLLDASLAAPRQQITDAAAERDQKKENAVIEGQTEADLASDEARMVQNQAIADGRALVEVEKQKGLSQYQEEQSKLDSDLTRRHDSQQEEIKKTIGEEQGKADAAIKSGEEKARERAEQAKEEEEQERREHEKNKPRKKKKKWYQKVGDWFKSAIKKWTDALVSAVKKVFDVAKAFVKNVIEAAKNLAVGIIRTLRKTIVGMIKTFATVLRAMVNVFLALVPTLRDRINQAIDGAVTLAVETVGRVAKTLEDKVVALVDKVSSVVNKVIEVFELAVTTTIAVTQAILTGDFKEAAKRLFLAVCKTLGIPADEFLSILADAGGAMIDIIKKPASFLGNLLKSVKQGFGTFITNFKNRFVQGLTGWLFGNLAEGGIELPKKLDLQSIFMFIGQVLGFSYQYVRARATRKIGEKRVGILEKVTAQVKRLFTEGPAAVWAWIKDQAGKVKEMVVETVSQWLITQLVVKAATKLASMFTPVGAFVQAILMMYNTVMFFVERIKEIMSLVKAITSSFNQMAKGAISAAAAWIDQSMSKAIPIIIAFLARLLGLSGLGGKIRQIVKKLRAPVTNAIDFVLDKIIKGAEKVWGRVAKGARNVTAWWNAQEEFTDQSGEKHRLYFESDEEGRNSRLMIASDPMDFDLYLERLRNAEQKNGYQEVEDCYIPIQRDIAIIQKNKSSEKSKQELPHNLSKLSKTLKRVGGSKKSREITIGGELLAGALLGDFRENPSYWSMVGQALVGFSPLGLAADVRDTVAVLKKLLIDGKHNDLLLWLDLGLVIIAYVPGIGDAIKLAGRSGIKWMRQSKMAGQLLDYGKSVLLRAIAGVKESISLTRELALKWLDKCLYRLRVKSQDKVNVWVNKDSGISHYPGTYRFKKVESDTTRKSHWQKMIASEAQRRKYRRSKDSDWYGKGLSPKDGKRLRRDSDKISKNIKKFMIGTKEAPYSSHLIKGETSLKPVADHTVSIRNIALLEGFARLTRRQRAYIAAHWRNYAPLTPQVNIAKSHLEYDQFNEWRGLIKSIKRDNPRVNKDHLEEMIKLETEIKKDLKAMVDVFLEVNQKEGGGQWFTGSLSSSFYSSGGSN